LDTIEKNTKTQQNTTQHKAMGEVLLYAHKSRLVQSLIKLDHLIEVSIEFIDQQLKSD
jgi:hypothetical protein